jgi:hypothetical protein
MKQLIISMISISVFFSLALFVSGCSEETPVQVSHNEVDNYDQILQKRFADRMQTVSVQAATGTVYFKESLNHYAGMGFGHPSGSSFILQPESLIPPGEISWGDNVTITMTVEKDLLNNTLIYTFGPSGCLFEPAAILWISWSDLGTETANLYYVQKNGRFIKETPDDIDYEGKKFKVLIGHFSRYAVAYSN